MTAALSNFQLKGRNTMERLLTCIVCPRGCALTVSLDDGGCILSVEGNICKRGLAYAEAECTHPTRTVTSTVRCEDGEVVPVKTSAQIPKEKMFDIMRAINKTTAKNDVKIGDVIIENVENTGADIVATANR